MNKTASFRASPAAPSPLVSQPDDTVQAQTGNRYVNPVQE